MRLRIPQLLSFLTLDFVITFAPEARAQCNVVVDPVSATFHSVAPLGCAEVTSTAGTFGLQTGAIYSGFGVAGGFVNGEIDGVEKITIDYSPTPRPITEIVLAFLHPTGTFGEMVDETVWVRVDGDPTKEYNLQASSTFGHLGTFVFVDLLSSPDGVFRITNPFGPVLVTKLEFFVKPDPPGPGVPGPAGSDFSIVSVCSSPFRSVMRPNDMHGCPDLRGAGRPVLNFTGSAPPRLLERNLGSTGNTWLTVFDETPHTPPAYPTPASDQTIFTGSVNLTADVLIRRFNNKKGAGLLALFNEEAGQKGLALILYNNGNTDSLVLATVDQTFVPGDFPGGKLTALRSVALRAGILENVWYRLEMDVVVSGDDLTVTGRAFRHTSPDDPDSAIGTQVGGTLTTPTLLSLAALGLQGSGEVGVVATAINAVVDSSVTNFEVSQD